MWSGSQPDGMETRYVISVVAQLTGLHPQTLRQYDRLEIVRPERTVGRGRRYSPEHVRQLRRVQDLTAQGVNLEGVRRILALEAEMQQLRAQLAAATSAPQWGEAMHPYLPVPYRVTDTSMVVWRPPGVDGQFR